ncbi:MAG: hypothetical protein R8N50_01355 [Alphaproteobacteria bacterium]|nr:hypothetical protein [Alphaproteobacteria bacterium]
MHQERGNFLLQALLAVGLIFAFIPFMVRQIAGRDTDSRMYSTTRQVDIAQTAARIFVREHARDIPYDTTVVSGNDFADMLEPYGLPLGFVPRTALGQDISLVLHKTPIAVSAYLELTGGDLSGVQRAELIRRIGYYATESGQDIHIGVELADLYSDVVRRNEPNLDAGGFLSDLDMGGFAFDNAGNLFAVRGEFDVAQFDTLTITGAESGKKAQNKIAEMYADKAVFQSKTGESALALSRGTLYTDTVNVRTISMFGDTGNFLVGDTAAYEFSMTAGHTSFTGGGDWNVRGNVVSNNINFSVERLDISSYLNTTRGQDVFIDADTLTYNSKSGIEVGTLYTSNITLRDQTSSALNDGASGAVLIDIRPGGTSLLPDAWVSEIDNSTFAIISNPSVDDGKTVGCESIIKDFEGVYNKQSLSQYLICQYVYWQRLEKRIDIKQCLMAGRSDCI